MKTIKLKNQKIEGDWSKRLLNDDDYDQVVTGPAIVYGPNDELVAVLLKNEFDRAQLQRAWKILKDVNLRTDNRGTAAGVDMVEHKKADGSTSKTRAVPKGHDVLSGVIGYYPRYPRIPFCRECSWNQHNPEKFKQLLPLFQRVNALHERYANESYNYQKSIVEGTSSDFVIPGTIYTTVTINKNFRTASHLDAKNLENGMAGMMLMRQGKYKGGLVVFPEWRIAAQMDTGDLIFFRNMIDYHGNTKIIPLSKDYQRCTLVFYYRSEMVKCGTKEQELERAKSEKDYSINFNEGNENANG